MVCKEDVIDWFKSLKSFKRTDVMCSLLHLCLPFELRFLGTCLEDLGKRDFHELRSTENEANSQAELNSPELQSITSQRARTKLPLYVSLLHSCNYACSNSIYKILTKNDDLTSVMKTAMSSEEALEDLLLIYTLALNHPAFSYEQKLSLEKILTRLHEEDKKLSDLSANRTKSFYTSASGASSKNQEINNPAPPPTPPPPPPIQSYQNCISMEDPQLIGGASPCPPLPTGAPHLTEHVFNLHDIGGMRLAYNPGFGLMNSPWSGVVVQAQEPPTSPLVSRSSSPCRSNSPSRPGSPPLQSQPTGPRAKPFPPPRIPISVDPVRETIGKEFSSYAGLQNYNPDQLSRMSDEELRDLGLPNNAVNQLRAILTKQSPSNGMSSTDLNPKKKGEPLEQEAMPRRFPPPPPLENCGVPMFIGPCILPTTHCSTCVMAPPRQGKCPLPHPPVPAYPIDQFRGIRIEPDPCFPASNSSGSDTASDHSPPDTPAPPPPQMGELGGVPQSSPFSPTNPDFVPQCFGMSSGSDDRSSRDSDERRANLGLSQARSRGPGGRHRSNPPGIQTQSLPRGRGPNPQRRREVGSNIPNGAIEERKMFGTDSSGAFYSPAGAPQYIGPAHHYIRPAYPTAAAPFPGGFVRHYPFQPNGEIVYQYPPPTQTFVPNPYTTLVHQPKTSCYNCGSQSHVSIDCPESTIEEVTKQGQYRIDYTSGKTSNETAHSTTLQAQPPPSSSSSSDK